MCLLNNTMGSADCVEFSGFMNSVHFNHKRKTRVISHQEYLCLTEAEYRTLYRTGKWTASRNDPAQVYLSIMVAEGAMIVIEGVGVVVAEVMEDVAEVVVAI